MVWSQVNADLIWVQTDCKRYQQTTKVTASKGKVKVSITTAADDTFRKLRLDISHVIPKSEYDQEIKQSHTADQPKPL